MPGNPPATRCCMITQQRTAAISGTDCSTKRRATTKPHYASAAVLGTSLPACSLCRQSYAGGQATVHGTSDSPWTALNTAYTPQQHYAGYTCINSLPLQR
jgi:hypothetical protein